MKKKLLSTFACLALVVMAGISLAACGSSATTGAIKLFTATETSKCTLTLGSGDDATEVEFSNDESLTITEKNSTFTVKGTASFMTEDQSKAYWGTADLVDEAYIVLEIELPAESKVSFEVYASEGTNITTGEDGKHYRTISNVSDADTTAKDDKLALIVLLSGDYALTTDTRTFTLTTNVGTESETSVVYTLNTASVEKTKTTTPAA